MKKDKFTIDKDDFISFLAHATPQDVSKYIEEHGKPRKLIRGIVYFESAENSKNKKA